MQDPLLKKDKCDFINTDMNGNEKEVCVSHVSKSSNHSVTAERGSSNISEQYTLPVKSFSEDRQMNQKTCRDDTRKLSPLRISKTRILFWNEQKDDDDETPEYPLKEEDAFLNANAKVNEILRNRMNSKKGDQSRNLFTEFAVSVPIQMSPGNRIRLPVNADVYKNGDLDEKDQQRFPKIPMASLQESTDIVTLSKSDIPKTQERGSDFKPVSLSSFIEETNNNDIKSMNINGKAKIMCSDEKLNNESKEDSQKISEQIPLLSPVVVQNNEYSYMLPSPQCPSQPPILTHFCDENVDMKLKTEEIQNYTSQIQNETQELSSKQKIPLHAHVQKEEEQNSSVSTSTQDGSVSDLKSSDHLVKSEKDNAEKQSQVVSHSDDEQNALGVLKHQQLLEVSNKSSHIKSRVTVEEKLSNTKTVHADDCENTGGDSIHNSTDYKVFKSSSDETSTSDCCTNESSNSNKSSIYKSHSDGHGESNKNRNLMGSNTRYENNNNKGIITCNEDDKEDLITNRKIINVGQPFSSPPEKTPLWQSEQTLHSEKQKSFTSLADFQNKVAEKSPFTETHAKDDTSESAQSCLITTKQQKTLEQSAAPLPVEPVTPIDTPAFENAELCDTHIGNGGSESPASSKDNIIIPLKQSLSEFTQCDVTKKKTDSVETSEKFLSSLAKRSEIYLTNKTGLSETSSANCREPSCLILPSKRALESEYRKIGPNRCSTSDFNTMTDAVKLQPQCESSVKKLRMETSCRGPDITTNFSVHCDYTLANNCKSSSEEKILLSPAQSYHITHSDSLSHSTDCRRQDYTLCSAIQKENFVKSQPSNEEHCKGMPLNRDQLHLDTPRYSSTVCQHIVDTKNLAGSEHSMDVAVSGKQSVSTNISTFQSLQTFDKNKENAAFSCENFGSQLGKSTNHLVHEKIPKVTVLPISSADYKNTGNNVLSYTQDLYPHQRSNMPDRNAMSKSLTVLDSAAKNMALNIIQRTAERNISCTQETDGKAKQLNYFKRNSNQTVETVTKSDITEIKNIALESVGDNQKTSALEMNSSLESCQNSQKKIHMYDYMDTSNYLHHHEALLRQAAARDRALNRSSVQSEVTSHCLDIQTFKHIHPQNSPLQSAYCDPHWKNMPYRPHFSGDTNVRNLVLPPVIPSVQHKSLSRMSSNSYNTAAASASRGMLKLGHQSTLNRPIVHTIPLSPGELNIQRHLHASQIRHMQQPNEHKAPHMYPSWVQIPTNCTTRALTEMPHQQLTKYSDPHSMYREYMQNCHHKGTSRNMNSRSNSSTYSQVSHVTPARDVHLNESLLDSQRPSYGKNNRLSMMEDTTVVHCVPQDIPDEPLDLSRSTDTQKDAVKRSSKFLNPQPQMLTHEDINNSNSSSIQSKYSTIYHHSQSVETPAHLFLAGNTCNQLSLPCYNDSHGRHLLALSKKSLSWPVASSIYSPPATPTSLKSPVTSHDLSLRGTALLHNSFTENINHQRSKSLESSNTQVPQSFTSEPMFSSNNGKTDGTVKKLLAQHTSTSLEASKACSVSISDKLLIDSQIPVMTSSVLISPLISQEQVMHLPAALPVPEITKSMVSSENTPGMVNSPPVTPSPDECVRLAAQQQRANSQHSSDSNASPTLRSDDFTCTPQTVSLKVAPLPVKDFFTSISKENTYSSLLMAKITSQHKKPHDHQKDIEALPFSEARETTNGHVCETDNSLILSNSLGRNFVIDLTKGDDDCDKLKIISEENELLSKADKNKVSAGVSEEYARTDEIQVTHTEQTRNLSSPQVLDKINHTRSSIGTPCFNTEAHHSENLQFTAIANSSKFCFPVTNYEKFQTQENRSCIGYAPHTLCNTVTDSEEALRANTSTENLNSQPGIQTHFHYHQYSSDSCRTDEVSGKKLGAVNSNWISSSLKIAPKGKEIMAKKLKTAVASWVLPHEQCGGVSFPLIKGDNEKTCPSVLQSDSINLDEVTNVSTHDNSTQRAAATLLELSANPIYSQYMLLPETSDDYQEKVYQIHHKLQGDNTNGEYPAHDDRNNNSSECERLESHDITRISTNKSGTRTNRRVGRPPKDQYTNSDNDRSFEMNTGSLNSVISRANTVSSDTSPLTHVSVSTASSCSNHYSSPCSVSMSNGFSEAPVNSQTTPPVLFPLAATLAVPESQTLYLTQMIPNIRVLPQYTTAASKAELLKHLTDTPAISSQVSVPSHECMEVTNEDRVQASSQQDLSNFARSSVTNHSISAAGTYNAMSNTVFSSASVHTKASCDGCQSSSGAGLCDKNCGDVIYSNTLNTDTTAFGGLAQATVNSTCSSLPGKTFQTYNTPLTHTGLPIINRDYAFVSSTIPSHVRIHTSNITPHISVENSVFSNKLNTVTTVPSEQEFIHKRSALKQRTVTRGRQKQKCLKRNFSTQEKPPTVPTLHNEQSQLAMSVEESPTRLPDTAISETEISGQYNAMSNAKSCQNQSQCGYTNKRKSRTLCGMTARKRKRASIKSSNEKCMEQEEDVRNEIFTNSITKTSNEDQLHVPSPEEISREEATEDTLHDTQNNKQENHQQNASTASGVSEVPFPYRAEPKSAACAGSVELYHHAAVLTVARHELADTEANESEKEKEVTSLLAAMMYSKTKGHNS